MFKIAIDITALRDKPSGIGIYILNLIKSLYPLQVSEEFQLTLSYQPSLKKWLKLDLSLPQQQLPLDIPIYTLPLPVTISHQLSRFPNPILSALEPSLGYPDILHGTDHVVYPCKHSQKIITIHDITFIKYPQYSPKIVQTYYQRIKQCLKWTDLVITMSQNTKQDIIKSLGVKPDNIHVIPEASRYRVGYLSSTQIEKLPNTINYNWQQPYLLFVSTIEPRKNLVTLIKAFNLLKSQNKIEHNLVIIGKKGWKYQASLAAIENSPYRNNIKHLDYISEELLALFYTKADVFIYPSYYEGFGLPILEAMTFGAPVITSNTSSLPEVAGDAAILINPQDIKLITK